MQRNPNSDAKLGQGFKRVDEEQESYAKGISN
jgi:hypothetical protein